MDNIFLIVDSTTNTVLNRIILNTPDSYPLDPGTYLDQDATADIGWQKVDGVYQPPAPPPAPDSQPDSPTDTPS